MMGCYVYLLRAGPYAKIGIADDIGRRVAQLQTACPERIEVASRKWVCCRSHALEIEAALHDDFKRQKRHTYGEWFRGDALLESHFEWEYAQKISMCVDPDVVSECARKFVGVPWVPVTEDYMRETPLFDIGDDRAHMAPPSVVDGNEELGYAVYGGWPGQPIDTIGWYIKRGDILRMIAFGGTWAESDIGVIAKAIRDHESCWRNQFELDPAYLLPARCHRSASPETLARLEV